ncbi:MAG: hypothetical protein AAB776_00660 [Patescibacteria group bacterium]
MALALKVVVLMFVLTAVIGGGAYVFGWFGQTANVAKEEFGPRAALEKYEWFKDAAAQLEKKQADVTVYQGRLDQMAADYAGKTRDDWPREDRQQYNTWASEVAGVKASYNQLAAEYNANMAKVNWQFAEVGDLPPGAETPLPREFKPYMGE